MIYDVMTKVNEKITNFVIKNKIKKFVCSWTDSFSVYYRLTKNQYEIHIEVFFYIDIDNIDISMTEYKKDTVICQHYIKDAISIDQGLSMIILDKRLEKLKRIMK